MLANQDAAPELNTSFTEPLYFLERRFLSRRSLSQEWFLQEWQKTKAPVYGSVDLRNAGFKLAPIDMNLFPAGFNNLNPNFLSQTISAARKSILQQVTDAKRILIIPESHTRNLFYWENVKTLQKILEQAGFQVRLSMLPADEPLPDEITLASGEKITNEKILRENNR